MSTSTFDPNTPVTMTPAALAHFERTLAQAEGHIVRLSIEKNGCSGYGYDLKLADEAQAADTVVRLSDTVTLAISAEALDILHGTEIDMVTEGVNRVIKYNNPNVSAECGCGESFSVN